MNTKNYAMCTLFALALLSGQATGSGESESESESESELSQGGRLYDKWWAELGLDKPADTHPADPATGKQSGVDT